MRPLRRRRARRDPAPSRLRYRLTRLWLSPWARRGLTVVLPAALLIALAAGQLRRPEIRAAIAAAAADLRATIEARPEFRLTRLEVVGGSAALRAEVTEAAGVGLPVSSLAIDIDAIRRRVAALGAVADARVSVSAGGTLTISVTERVPVAILRRGGALGLIDAEGHLIARLAARAARPDLPLLAGAGAEAAVAEALELVARAGPVAGRLRGLVRVGERRWDLVLDRGQRIMLPERGAAEALDRVMALQRSQGVLDRDVTRVDLRDPARPVLRLGPRALRARRDGMHPDGEDT
ncbi:MAG: FtsQ-type POTRA domain-containing protein [Alphaproteobacteria bacterium]|nr:MAG: FtsQ-type POTRA domain-containing protein [Alphaproteobacteria bacterium]